MTEPELPAAGPHLEPARSDQQPADHPHVFVQAPVPALDVDGLGVVVVGIVAFAVASVVLFLMPERLEAAGHSWWLGVAISGFVLGLIGLGYSWNRRRRRRAGQWHNN